MNSSILIVCLILCGQFYVIDCQSSKFLEKLYKIFNDGDAKNLTTLRKDLVDLLDSEKIDGIPIPVDFAKALINTIDLKDFLPNGVDFLAIASAAAAGGNVAETAIKTTKFDVLQRSWDIPAMFRQPNVTEMIRNAGMSPKLLEAFLVNVDFKEFVDAVQLAKVLELYSPANNVSDSQKSKSLIKLINTKKLVASINWKGLQNDQNLLNYLDSLPQPATVDGRLLKAVIQNLDLENVMMNGVDLDNVIGDVLFGNSTFDAITENLNYTILLSSLNIATLLSQKNITEILKDNNIDPRLVKVLRHVDMEMFTDSANLGEIYKAYYTGDNTTRKMRFRLAAEKMNSEGIQKSVQWKELQDDQNFKGLVQKYVPVQYRQIVFTTDLEKLVSRINVKGLIMETLTSPNTPDYAKYFMSVEVLQVLDLGTIVQSYLNTTTKMDLSQQCQDQLIQMAFPLPSFNNINLNGLSGLKAIQHPLIQCK